MCPQDLHRADTDASGDGDGKAGDSGGEAGSDEDGDKADDGAAPDTDALNWVFNRVSRLIRPRRDVCRAAGLRFIGAVASKLEAEQLLPYLVRGARLCRSTPPPLPAPAKCLT